MEVQKNIIYSLLECCSVLDEGDESDKWGEDEPYGVLNYLNENGVDYHLSMLVLTDDNLDSKDWYFGVYKYGSDDGANVGVRYENGEICIYSFEYEEMEGVGVKLYAIIIEHIILVSASMGCNIVKANYGHYSEDESNMFTAYGFESFDGGFQMKLQDMRHPLISALCVVAGKVRAFVSNFTFVDYYLNDKGYYFIAKSEKWEHLCFRVCNVDGILSSIGLTVQGNSVYINYLNKPLQDELLIEKIMTQVVVFTLNKRKDFIKVKNDVPGLDVYLNVLKAILRTDKTIRVLYL